jgi:hypothetical protein
LGHWQALDQVVQRQTHAVGEDHEREQTGLGLRALEFPDLGAVQPGVVCEFFLAVGAPLLGGFLFKLRILSPNSRRICARSALYAFQVLIGRALWAGCRQM